MNLSISILFLIFAFPLHAQYVIQSDQVSQEPLYVNPSMQVETEVTLLDQVIAATEKTVEQQKQLRSLIVDYQELYRQYKENTTDKRLCYLLVKKAHESLALMKELELTQAFNQQFLSELTFFANIAGRSRS